MKKVLIAPVARSFGPNFVSENGWVFDIFTGMLEDASNFEFICISENIASDELPRTKLYSLGPRVFEQLGGFTLPYRVYRKSKSLKILDDVDIVHHALPFSLDRTFSIVCKHAYKRGIPIIIGPVQSPLIHEGKVESTIEDGPASLIDKFLYFVQNLISKLLGPLLKSNSTKFLLIASKIVCIDDATRQLLIERGVIESRIEVIPPPVRIESAEAIECIPCDQLVITTASYLFKRKNIDIIISAVSDLNSQGIRTSLNVIGDGPQLGALETLTKELGLEELVTFYGWLDRPALIEIFKRSSVYVSMSRSESWGQSVVEALSFGLPVISSRNQGSLSIHRLGAPLQLLRESTPLSLSEELKKYSRLELSEIHSIRADSFSWCSSNLSKVAVARKWLETYSLVLSEMSK